MRKNFNRRILSVLLMLCMLLSLLPLPIVAEEEATQDTELETQQEETTEGGDTQITYSDLDVSFDDTEPLLSELSGENTVILRRGGNVSESLTLTLLVYDNSARYGEDYRLIYGGEVIEKIDGATTIYDAFRDGGRINEGWTMTVTTEEIEEAEANGEIKDEIRAADMLAELDSLNVLAAHIPVTFEAGSGTTEITVEVLDDALSEYEESFLLAVLDPNGEVIEDAMFLLGIEDNEDPPIVTVTFDCDEILTADPDTGTAAMVFRRAGDLATSTEALLCKDGEALGYVDFTPYQEQQIVYVEPGTYALYPGEGYNVSTATVTVRATDGSVTVPEGADPDLDAIPNAYAPIEDGADERAATRIPSWYPSWARTTGTNETSDYITYVNNYSTSFFFEKWTKGLGEYEYNKNGYGDLDTSGTGSHIHTGYVQVWSNNKYDMTGIESIETTVYVDGLDKTNHIIIGLHTGSNEVGRNTLENKQDETTVTTKYTLPNKTQGNYYVFVENKDPTNSDDGCSIYIPNGFKANKRTYCFEVLDALPANFFGVGVIDITCQNESGTILKKMGDNSKVTIAYTVEDNMPVKLVGYRLKNLSTGEISSIIPIDGNSFNFTKSFLTSYESTFGVNTMKNGTTYCTFGIVPVFEKIEVSVTLETATLGTISIRNSYSGQKFYAGEKIVIDGDPVDGANLGGVYYKYYKNLSGSISQSGTIDVDSTKSVTISLGKEYNKVVLQGSFGTTVDRLMVNYLETNASQRHGTLAFNAGVVVKPSEYVKNDYFPLIAQPDDGYVTRWISDSRVFYGNTYYYQLDGNANHNWIKVEFVRASSVTQRTGTLRGTLTVGDVQLRSLTDSTVPLSNVSFTIYADKEYTGTTDENGNYSISDFTAVVGGNYTMQVVYRNMIGYAEFTPYTGISTTTYANVTLPQFASGSIYPSDIDVSLGYVASSNNVIQVRPTDTGEITVEVTNEAKGEISDVTLHFLSTSSENYGAELTTIKMNLNETLTAQGNADLFSYWTAKIGDTSVLPVNSEMYVSVTATKNYTGLDITTDDNGNIIRTALSTTVVPCNSGLVDTGYELITAITDTSILLEQTIPDVPGATNAASTGSEIEIPVLGWADFSLTSKSGGYFVQKVENGTTYLICGYSIAPVYGVSTLDVKLKNAMDTQAALSQKASASTSQITGGADPESILIGQGTGSQAGQGAAQTTQKKSSNWSIDPAFYFKFALGSTQDENGESRTYVKGFEIALGFDAYYMKNIPFSVQGLPMYICFTTQIEALVQIQATMNSDLGSDMSLALYDMCQTPTEANKNQEDSSASFIAVPTLSLGLKSGVGYNSFLSAYVSGSVSVPMIFQVDPYFDVAGEIGFAFNCGADLIFFTANYNVLSVSAQFGNNNIYDDLHTVQAGMNKTKGTTFDTYDLSDADEDTVVLGENDATPSVEEMFNSMTFSFMERPESGTSLMRSATVDSATLAENVFKNTQVQLVQLGNGNIMALFLVDNGEDGYNYLSAAYAISSDNGSTWSDLNYVSSNIGQANTSLQFDISVFELEDRILITWSDADFDTLLSELDKDNLTLGQIASLMNAMNLCGRFFDKESGEPMGEAFTVAEHSTVACGALDAVQNGENVYIYYQRNSFPTGEDVELTDLLTTDRTVALARANVNDPTTWTSTSVRALNEDGQQYRITEVTPFVHDGVMGEILVIDRNGKLSVYDAESGEWEADNEDRQLYLRTYDFDADGTPVPTALIALTDASDCAQSPQVVSNDDYLHLFWNQNGKVVYLTDFVATYVDHEDVQSAAILVKNADGTMTVQNLDEINGHSIAGSESLNVGTTFTASMADDGNVLLAWIGNEEGSTDLIPTEEIYGVILNTVTNAEAIARCTEETFEEGGNENVYQLWPVGSPIALTDENSLIGALDSICMESGAENKFLLAFTKLNATVREDVTSADLLAVQSTDAPRLEITEISADAYPMPGSDLTVRITAANYGLEPLDGATFAVSGLGDAVSVKFDGAILPGETVTVDVTVAIPADFAETTTLTASVCGVGAQASYTASDVFTVNYAPYFVMEEMSALTAVPNCADCESVTTLRNIGNAAGCPTLTFVNTIYGSGEYELNYVYESDTIIEPNGVAAISYTLTDTLINTEKTAYLRVSVGDGADQAQASHMPVAIVGMTQTAESENAFTDIEGHWAQDAIESVYADGLMNGMSATTFEPETTMTRAMLVTVLYRMAGEPSVTGTVPYSDVLENFWYTDAIVWATENGIVEGIGKGLFDPDSGVTREQMAAIFYRYAEFVGFDTSSRTTLATFPDAAQCSSYAIMPLSWAVSIDLIQGTRKVDTVYLDPQGYATRAQVATVIQRFRETLRMNTP